MKHLTPDKLWKSAIEEYINDFILYFYPRWQNEGLDLSKKPEFMEQELLTISEDIEVKDRIVDKLVKVHFKNNRFKVIFLHIEVQGYPDPSFAYRMYNYYQRISIKYKDRVEGMVIYTHKNIEQMPIIYRDFSEDSGVLYKFKGIKIHELTEVELNKPHNIFSIVMLTVKQALSAKNNKDLTQLEWKKKLITALYDTNFNRIQIESLFIFIGNYVTFSKDKSIEDYKSHIGTTFKTEKTMGIKELYLESVKKEAKEQGIEQGVQKGIEYSLIILLQKGQLSLEEIAETFNISLEEVKAIKDKAGISKG